MSAGDSPASVMRRLYYYAYKKQVCDLNRQTAWSASSVQNKNRSRQFMEEAGSACQWASLWLRLNHFSLHPFPPLLLSLWFWHASFSPLRCVFFKKKNPKKAKYIMALNKHNPTCLIAIFVCDIRLWIDISIHPPIHPGLRLVRKHGLVFQMKQRLVAATAASIFHPL